MQYEQKSDGGHQIHDLSAHLVCLVYVCSVWSMSGLCLVCLVYVWSTSAPSGLRLVYVWSKSAPSGLKSWVLVSGQRFHAFFLDISPMYKVFVPPKDFIAITKSCLQKMALSLFSVQKFTFGLGESVFTPDCQFFFSFIFVLLVSYLLFTGCPGNLQKVKKKKKK